MSRNLLMITGLGSATDLAQGKKGAFYNTLEEFHKYWNRIDIIVPRVGGVVVTELFGNVHLHISTWPLILHPTFFVREGINLNNKYHFSLMTVQDFPPFYNGIGAYLLSLATHVPYVLEIMHIPGLPKAGSFKEFCYKYLTKFFIRFDAHRARAIRVINQKQTKDFLIQSGVPASKIKYIPAFYIDLDIFKPLRLDKKYDLIFVGRLEKNKGLNLLLEIAQKTDFKIMIVGNGALKNYCKLKIENWKLQNRVILHGFAEDSFEVVKLINESKALVMLSYNEGGPRVILESLACGVPVIATPVGIVSDVVNHNNGRIVTWSAEDVIKAFEEIKDIKIIVDMSQFEKKIAVKNYAETLQSFI